MVRSGEGVPPRTGLRSSYTSIDFVSDAIRSRRLIGPCHGVHRLLNDSNFSQAQEKTFSLTHLVGTSKYFNLLRQVAPHPITAGGGDWLLPVVGVNTQKKTSHQTLFFSSSNLFIDSLLKRDSVRNSATLRYDSS